MTKSILITGCSSGIGLCVAQGLQQRGYQVFASARHPDAVARLQAQGLTSLVLDLNSSDSIQRSFETVMQATGGHLYALFNNGAYGQPGAVEDLTREALRQQFETNVFGTQELTNYALKVMRQQGYGRIIYNSSILGFVAMPYRGAYNASKFALEGLSDTLRLELRGSQIFVSLIEPGPITSHFRANALLAYRAHIRPETSYHREYYQQLEARLAAEGAVTRFTLPPDAVLKKVIHALESPHPQIRYPVTTPTYAFAVLKRLLPAAWLDRLLAAAGK